MKSPADMKIIQIEITNACIHKCSNCTRFCGHHQTPFFMSFDDFKKAVDSLKDFQGTVGVMGGEPTLHPQFKEFIAYLKEKRSDTSVFPMFKRPVRDFNTYHSSHLTKLSGRKRGLWSALGNKYYEHFEQIQDTFAYQCINDHRNAGLHQALLITRKELQIPDDEWFSLRDKCWIQNEWSASITPKGCFFCEIAAALDMLFDGPGGWPVDSDWWKRTPEDFKDQLYWCELCSAALPVPSNLGNEEKDIISPVMLKKIMEKGGSYKVLHKDYHLFEPDKYDRKKYSVNHCPEPYLSADDKRVAQDSSSSLFPREIAVCNVANSSSVAERVITVEDAENLKFNDWLLIVLNPTFPTEQVIKNIKTLIFNPGVCYYAPGEFFLICRRASALAGVKYVKVRDVLSIYPKDKKFCLKNLKNPDKIPLLERPRDFLERIFWCLYRTLGI